MLLFQPVAKSCNNHYRKDGFLFDKEVILEYIIKKKNDYSRKLKEYERLKRKAEEDNAQKTASDINKKVTTFLKDENNIVSRPIGGFATGKYIF